jgi:hypothetical protein
MGFPVGARLAREKRPDNAFIQTARVIVDVHRRQAGSYRRDVYMATSNTGISQSLLVIDMYGFMCHLPLERRACRQ